MKTKFLSSSFFFNFIFFKISSSLFELISISIFELSFTFKNSCKYKNASNWEYTPSLSIILGYKKSIICLLKSLSKSKQIYSNISLSLCIPKHLNIINKGISFVKFGTITLIELPLTLFFSLQIIILFTLAGSNLVSGEHLISASNLL